MLFSKTACAVTPIAGEAGAGATGNRSSGRWTFSLGADARDARRGGNFRRTVDAPQGPGAMQREAVRHA